MTSREQFEAKCRNGLINGGLAKHENGKYPSELTDAVWRGWQASREAVEVELPAWFVWGAIAVFDRDEVEKAMSDAGIKVKGE